MSLDNQHEQHLIQSIRFMYIDHEATYQLLPGNKRM